MAELAAALGVDGVITGSVGKFDQTYQVNVSVVSSRDGRTLSAFSRKVNGSSAVLDALNDAADQMARELPKAFGRVPTPSNQIVVARPPPHQPLTPVAPEPTPEAPPKPLTLRDWFWVPGGLGVLMGAGSGFFFVQAKAAADQLQAAAAPGATRMTLDEANAVRARGVMGQTLGISMAAVAGIGLGVGAYCFVAGGPSQPVALRITPGPTGVVVSGNFR
jgi:hypothetical protein